MTKQSKTIFKHRGDAMNREQIRQGDVFLSPIPRVARKDFMPVKPENGRVILARGEATGHNHSMASDSTALMERDGQTVLIVHEDRLRFYPPQMMVKSQLTGKNPVTLAQAILSGAVGELLIHQEHTADVVGIGDWIVVIQRTYLPDAIRSVMD
jgi:hypothetical protein